MNIIITGSNRGIGAAIAKNWCSLDSKNLYYGISRYNDFDVKNSNCLDELLSFEFEKEYRPIALINNAGTIKLGSINELSFDDWKEQFDVNVHGVFNCSKAYIKYCMKNNIEGKIINIASTAGLNARPGRAAYSATKAAVINFSLSLSEELRSYNIKVYCVCPGACDTDMRHYINPDDDFENMMKPEEVAIFICDLINYGNNLDGQILTIKK